MVHQKLLFGTIITLFNLLIFTIGNESLNNNCDFSQGHKILTCINLNEVTPDLGNLIKDDTHLLIIKGSRNLVLPANLHNNKNFKHLSSYQLIYNGIIEINAFAFNKLENLRSLKISNNQQWDVLQTNTFSGLSKLETLNIVNNSIKLLQNDAFESLENLDILEMMYNNYKIVPSSIFKSLQSLTSLFLYHSNIETLENGCFQGLYQIRLLDVTHNKLKHVKTSVFEGLTELSDLYLSFNEIESIEGEFALENLKFLYLQHNKLKIVSENIFKSSGNLKAVDLSYNEISVVDGNAFYYLKSLDHLNLAHNNVASYDNLTFNDLNKPLLIV